MPLKKEGVKSSSKKPLKKRGGTGPQSALALNRKNAKTYALAERMQGRSPPRSALSAIYRRLKPPENPPPENPPPENPPLEKPQSAKTVNGDSLMRLIRILHRTKKSKEP
jgi:hypothetical protein